MNANIGHKRGILHNPEHPQSGFKTVPNSIFTHSLFPAPALRCTRRALVGLSCVVFALAVFACSSLAQSEIKRPVVRENRAREVILSGKLYYTGVSRVRTDKEGILKENLVTMGDTVVRDQPMAVLKLTDEMIEDLRPRSMNPNIQQAQAQLFEAQTILEAARRERSEMRRMVEEGLAVEKSLTPMDRKIKLLEMQLAILEQNVREEKRKLDKSLEELAEDLGVDHVRPGTIPRTINVKATRTGTVLWSRDFPSGRLIADNSRLFDIGRSDPIIIKVRVYEDDYRYLSLGDIADCTLKGKKSTKFKATLSRLPLTPDSKKAGQPSYYDVEFSAPNSDFELREGYTVNLSIKPGNGDN